MTPTSVIFWTAVTVVAVLASHHLSKAYCRIYSVEEHAPTVWVAARPAGVVIGAVVWAGLRLVSPDVTPTTVHPLWLAVGSDILVNAVLLGVWDVAIHRWFITEPTYAEAREALLNHGSCEDDVETDWIDVTIYGGEQ